MTGPVDRDGAALVAFTGHTGLRFLRCLKPGFRHCLIAVKKGEHWILCDSLAHQLHLDVVSGLDSIDLEFWLRSQGYQVVRHDVCPALPRTRFFRPFTCVEAAKRILGIEALWIVTPWQLYRHLQKKEILKIGKNTIK